MGKKSKRRGGGAPRHRQQQQQQQQQPSTALSDPAPPTHRAAIQARQRRHQDRGEPRAEVDRMMEEFERLSSLHQDDPWNVARINAFLAYYHQLMEEVTQKTSGFSKFYTEKDLDLLKKLGRSKTETAVCRVLAQYASGLMSFLAEDAQAQAVWNFDDAIIACDSASDEVKEKILYLGAPVRPVKVGDLLKEIRKKAVKFFTFEPDSYTHAWTPNHHATIVPLIAGVQCDFCGKRREVLGMRFLKYCRKCKMAHYCSLECQRHDWEMHKKVCRKKGEYKVGDMVVTLEPFGNVCRFELVRIKAPADEDLEPKNQTQWVVESLEGEETGIVPVGRLERVRPVLWNTWTDEDFKLQLQECRESPDHAESANDGEGGENPLPDLVFRAEMDENLEP